MRPDLMRPDLVRPDLVRPDLVRPDLVRADKAYRAICAHLCRRGAAAIPVRATRSGTRSGRAAAVVVYPPSMRPTTAAAMPWGAVSAALSASGTGPPATNPLSVRYRAVSRSPPSMNGSTYFET
ncbi:hypothetical protein Acsp04_50940 [Actinomadura sp. NBRC 104425]|nr:hypothetical protein Acsp04_50940 [Actinomadura sp. NBRC 104425]